jgi:DNA repair protein RadC
MKIITKYQVQLVKESSRKYDLETKLIASPDMAVHAIREVFQLDSSPQEKFVVLALNIKNRLIGAFEVFAGSINSSIVHPRDIFQRLLLTNATAFIAAHNHPSGDPTPSCEDIEVTKRLVDCGRIMDIELLDHLIIGEDGKYCSLKAEGYV